LLFVGCNRWLSMTTEELFPLTGTQRTACFLARDAGGGGDADAE
jgi:hypothetical protein